MSDVAEIAGGLSVREKAWVLCTPVHVPSAACLINGVVAKRFCRAETGRAFAAFAITDAELFQRTLGRSGVWTYRLSELGAAVRTHLESNPR